MHNDCTEAMTALKRLILEAIENTKSITKKWGDFKCVECADEVKNMLISKGLNGKQLFNIWSDIANKNISTNGFHTGILLDGKVYDNIFKDGILLEDWLTDLHCPGILNRTDIDF